MHHLHPVFTNKEKNWVGPSPSRERKQPPLYIRWTYSRIMYILGIVAKIPHNFGENINKQSAKKRLRMHHLHHFFKNSLGETTTPQLLLQENKKNSPLFRGSSWAPTCRRGIHSRTLPQAAPCTDLVTPPPFPSSEPSGSALARSKNIRFTFAHWRLNASMYLRDLNHLRCSHGPVNMH